MYAYLNGILAAADNQNIVIDVQGVGYNVIISTGKNAFLPPLGDPLKVYTYTSVREDAFLLYGFLRKEELDLFRKLITVSSVGPKYAMNLLGALSAEEIVCAITQEDAKKLTLASGVGLKMAQKIILELKNKVDALGILLNTSSDVSILQKEKETLEATDAIMALVSLGYAQTDARRAVLAAAKDFPDADSETLLKGALRYI